MASVPEWKLRVEGMWLNEEEERVENDLRYKIKNNHREHRESRGKSDHEIT